MNTKSLLQFYNNIFINKKPALADYSYPHNPVRNKNIFFNSAFKRLTIIIIRIFRNSLRLELKLFSLLTLTLIYTNSIAAEKTQRPFRWGIAYDLMAPRIGDLTSVNLDASLSYGQFKHTLFFAHININDDHLTDESFCKDNLNGFGYRFEIFSHNEAKNWSAGLLFMYSMHDVTTVHNKQEGSFNTIFIGVPLGYTWVLWDRVTINPNVSILVPITNRTVTIGADKEKQAPWGLEPGIRIGYRF